MNNTPLALLMHVQNMHIPDRKKGKKRQCVLGVSLGLGVTFLSHSGIYSIQSTQQTTHSILNMQYVFFVLDRS